VLVALPTCWVEGWLEQGSFDIEILEGFKKRAIGDDDDG
jgi:hypothetical protein